MRKNGHVTESETRKRYIEDTKARIKKSITAGGQLVVNSFANRTGSTVTWEISCDGDYVGIVKKYSYDNCPDEFFVIASGVGISDSKVKSLSDGLSKILKKVGV